MSHSSFVAPFDGYYQLRPSPAYDWSGSVLSEVSDWETGATLEPMTYRLKAGDVIQHDKDAIVFPI